MQMLPEHSYLYTCQEIVDCDCCGIDSGKHVPTSTESYCLARPDWQLLNDSACNTLFTFRKFLHQKFSQSAALSLHMEAQSMIIPQNILLYPWEAKPSYEWDLSAFTQQEDSQQEAKSGYVLLFLMK